jgi:type IV secretion system protein VirB10
VRVTKSLFHMALLSCCLLAAAGCDDKAPPRRAQAKLALPQGDSALDAMLKKPPPPPPEPPRLEAAPVSYSFPLQVAGAMAHGEIRLTNGGGGPLTLGPLRIAGQSAEFKLAGDCRAGLVLAPGAACAIDVVYHPRRGGSSLAELVVDQGAAGPSLFLPIGGDAMDERPVEQRRASIDARASLIYASARQAAPLTIAASPDSEDQAPSSPDYGEAGLPGVVSSFPVDRSRVLTADRYIPAVLENTLNSELPGRAIAVVERPVFGEDQRLVLIPAGSRIIGSYKSGAKYGQARLDISWSRILRPDGATINIEASGADVMGRAGIPGDLDSRLVEKYGSSFLTSVIAAAGTWALAGTSTVSTSALGATETLSPRAQAANRLGNDTDTLAQRMVQDNVDIRPVLTVPAGTRLVIIPTEDIWLRDPDHLQPVTPPKEARNQIKPGTPAALMELLPSLVDTVAQTPAVQRAMPQTAQQLMQSSLLQQLRADPTLGGALAAPPKPDTP